MPRPDDHRRAAADRALPVRMRGDLQVIEVTYSGDAAFVVLDPVSEESFHLTAEEYSLLDALRQPTSLRDLQRIFESRFAPRRVTIGELQRFVNRLYEQGLLLGENSGQGAELLSRGLQRRRRERAASLLQLLSIRVARLNAEPLVEPLHAAFGWLCSRPAIAAALCLTALSTLLVVANAAEFAARMPTVGELTDLRRLPLWIAAIVGVKVLHELGHALACRHWGARPKEFGVLLLAGMPSLYCDVSDAWRLTNKWQRMAVSAAGICVELVIASLAVLVWRYAEPGQLSAVCLSLIVVCSVGTLLVNANPLLRYDGYYLLVDWLEVPNLAERARGLVSGAWRRWLLGEPTPVDPLLSPAKRRALWIYAMLAKFYLALVLGGVFWLLLKLARPHGLENAVYTLTALTLAGMLAQPVASAFHMAANPSVRARFRWQRFSAAAGATLALLAAVAMIPITRRVEAPLTILPAKSHPLFAIAAGELEYVATAGAKVRAGDIVARLGNPELELALVEQQGVVREQQIRLAQLRTLQAVTPSAARMLPTAQAELTAAEQQLAEQQAMVDSLTIRAPVGGQVWPPPERLNEGQPLDTLASWTGSPLDGRNHGAWVNAGTPLAVIAASGGQVAWAGVEQADVPLVERGQTVRIIAEQAPLSVLKGKVTEVARRARSNRAESSSGTVHRETVLGPDRYHVVQIELTESAATLLPGIRGVAKIEAVESTLGAIVLEQLRRTFQRLF